MVSRLGPASFVSMSTVRRHVDLDALFRDPAHYDPCDWCVLLPDHVANPLLAMKVRMLS